MSPNGVTPNGVSHIELTVRDFERSVHFYRDLLGFKSFWAARCTIAGIEVMHAIRKGQLMTVGHASQTLAEQFYALAA